MLEREERVLNTQWAGCVKIVDVGGRGWASNPQFFLESHPETSTVFITVDLDRSQMKQGQRGGSR